MAFSYIFLLTFFSLIDCLPNVRVRPSSAVLPSSSEARLLCESLDTPFNSVVYWTHIGQRIEPSPSIIEMHGNELRLFQFGDTVYTQPGAYACVVSTRYGLMESEPAMLSLPTLDPFKILKNENQFINLTEENLAIIPCDLPNGNPRPIPIFYFNDEKMDVDSKPDRYQILPSGNLHILSTILSDTGKYQCSARNIITGQIVNNSHVTYLQVLEKPRALKERQSLSPIYKPKVASRVLVGDNFTIECAIAGWPKPTIEWEKYGDVLPERRHEVRHGTLYLTDIRLDDRGTYICRASSLNGQSDLAYTALLEVLEPPKLVERPDSLIQLKHDERLSIKCGFRGRPEPGITWLFNGEELNINEVPATGSILTLASPKMGIYQCIGRNLYGMAQASSAVVHAWRSKSEDLLDSNVSSKKSLILFGPNNITVSEGETVQLHCLTQPGSTVQWLHNNQIINLNQMRRYEMLPSGGLRIVSAQRSDSGIYECLASKIGVGTSTAKCTVQVQGLPMNVPVSKLDIVSVEQVTSGSVELRWRVNDKIANDLYYVQAQYRLIPSKGPWTTVNDRHNRSVDRMIVNNLQQDQTYKFRLIGFDDDGQQLVISATKRFTLGSNYPSLDSVSVEITDAWVTGDGHIGLKWRLLNQSAGDEIDGFVIYYRLISSKSNFTSINVPNKRFPPMNTYTITSLEPNQQYEFRISTYSNRGLSLMSNAIEIATSSVATQRQTRVNVPAPLSNFDEVLDNITKLQNPTQILYDIASSALATPQKNSDLLYLIIGIISGILFILILILIVMCILRLFQRKKLLAHMQSVNGSDYYCDGIHKNVNPDYATTPCLQHAIVAVDGKLIPFTYPTNTKSPKPFWPGNGPNSGPIENGTIRLNTNPISRHDEENLLDKQDNFYHTLTPFGCPSQYEAYQTNSISRTSNGYYTRSNASACPMHPRPGNYQSDTLRSKTCLNHHDTLSRNNSKCDACDSFSPLHVNAYHHAHHYYGTCQRQEKAKRTKNNSTINEVDQNHDSSNRSISSSSAAGIEHYCTHSSNESTRALLTTSQPSTHNRDQSKTSALSSIDSSSGIDCSMESPYNHWKYLTPLAVTTSNEIKHLSPKLIDPLVVSSS